MIQIPNQIKQLLKQGSVPKNFRVHFPNGEHADLTNKDIVSESVNFIESICSQQTLVFNTCETPMIEFETVGVENIKGCKIECSLEVICDSTITGAVYKSDIQKYVYPMLYGTYIVNSCKKQADMTHRQVIAYSGNMFVSSDDFQKWLSDRITFSSNSYKIDVFHNFISSNTDNFSLTDFSHTETYIYDNGTFTPSSINWRDSRYSYRITFSRTGDFPEVWEHQCSQRKLFYVEINPDLESTQKADILQVYDDMLNYNITEEASEELLSVLHQIYTPLYLYKKTTVGSESASINSTYYNLSEKSRFVAIPSEPYATDYYGNKYYDEILFGYRYVTIKFTQSTGAGTVSESTYTFNDIFSTSDFKIYEIDTTLPAFLTTFAVQQVGERAISSSPNKPVYSATNNFKTYNSRRDISALAELLGEFGKVGRDSQFTFLSLHDGFENPVVTLTPSDYFSLWYDDDVTKPYGKIACSYKNENGEDAYAETIIVENYSENTYKLYDISNNALIKSNKFTVSEIESIFSLIQSNIDNISYMPLNLIAIGRPDLEAGDVVTVTTLEGEDIPCLIMQRQLSGIQALSDSITATEEEEDVSSIQLDTSYDIESKTLSIWLQ